MNREHGRRAKSANNKANVQGRSGSYGWGERILSSSLHHAIALLFHIVVARLGPICIFVVALEAWDGRFRYF